MELVIGRGAFSRDRGAFPPWRQENCLLEPSKTDPKGYNILSRPPLAAYYTWGTGAVHGVFQRDGLFGGDLFAVIGTAPNRVLYRNGVSKGTINGTGPISWAGGFAELVVTGGATAYSYNGTGNAAAIVFPDSADVRAVNWMFRRFYFVRKASGRFYWSNLDDGRTVDALNYATAEGEPDELLDIKRVGDVFWMLGVSTGEAWVQTGDPDLPVTRIVQRNLNRGVQDTGCSEEIEGTVYLISSDGLVGRITEGFERVSDNSLEEKIAASTTGSTFFFQFEGKPILCIRLDSGTHGLDLSMDHQPVVFSTMGQTMWAPKCAVNVGSEPLFGDDTDPIIYRFDETSSTDSGFDEMRRVFSAGLPLNTQPMPIGNVIVSGNNGAAQVETGEQADPYLEMRVSRDGGRTFPISKSARWGQMGEYLRKARFGSCGSFNPPGFLAEFTLLACTPLRIDSVRANEDLAGRGR
jgi:hypothetical protein